MNQQTTKGYVYLLVSEDQKSFKIGKANEVNVRIDQLSKHWNFDLNSSYVIETDFNNTLNLERLLQRSLAYFKVEIFAKKDGYTEFFDIKGLDYILKYEDFFNETNKTILFKYSDYKQKTKTKINVVKKDFQPIQFSKSNNLFSFDMFFIICNKYLQTLNKEITVKMTDIIPKDIIKRIHFKEEITKDIISFLLNPINNYNKSLIKTDYKRSGKSFIFNINEDFFNKEIFSLLNKIKPEDIFKLRSAYSKQMYILIKQFNKEALLTKDYLNEYFHTPNSLRKKYFSLKQRILIHTTNEISLFSDIEVSFKEVKKLNTVNEIILSFKSKKEKEEKIVKNIKQLEDNFNKQIEKQKPINNQNYKPFKFNYTTQTLINTSF
ncbi:GIY-YIG nuclease family protein [Aliarcobacter butzleri]|uniref:GIY-YIG nuclease family protein n=1 Tax=Aliarcobacter butzleri TaxID=28197 RepID=UPI0021B2754B|nr:GIY-YIG nuclease family protein [Aliarcobacter butzleri]MCT7596084.1 GIY-YIG nuclease family protein [Aliarcobacter butzleri]